MFSPLTVYQSGLVVLWKLRSPVTVTVTGTEWVRNIIENLFQFFLCIKDMYVEWWARNVDSGPFYTDNVKTAFGRVKPAQDGAVPLAVPVHLNLESSWKYLQRTTFQLLGFVSKNMFFIATENLNKLSNKLSITILFTKVYLRYTRMKHKLIMQTKKFICQGQTVWKSLWQEEYWPFGPLILTVSCPAPAPRVSTINLLM